MFEEVVKAETTYGAEVPRTGVPGSEGSRKTQTKKSLVIQWKMVASWIKRVNNSN